MSYREEKEKWQPWLVAKLMFNQTLESTTNSIFYVLLEVFFCLVSKKMKKNIKTKFIKVVCFPLAFALFNSG